MARSSALYVCTDCGAEHAKWQGQCSACHAWNTLKEFRLPAQGKPKAAGSPGYGDATAEVALLADVAAAKEDRFGSGLAELDRVLGGGFVPGSVVLMGGDPGAGKSTLLLQVATSLGGGADGQGNTALYVSGEESIQQLAQRARRLGLARDSLRVASETSVDRIEALIAREAPRLVVVDSIQVMHVDTAVSLPGSVTQVRESAARLTRLAKQTDTTVVMVGHVTKEGNLAGPKVLEHMIDCFMMLDAPAGSRYRTLRGQKNRFGAVNELGVFAMTEEGMKEVTNPSAIFLERPKEAAPGSAVTVTWEGTRPLLVEIQALVDDVQGGHPRRVAVGLDAQRLAMHLAVLHRHCGVAMADQDVFANVVGGVRINETGADLALMAAVMSSFRARALPRDLVAFGEIGLTGEVRPAPNGQERLREAKKHGFTRAICPRANRPRQPIDGIQVHAVATLAEALDILRE
ncbi:MAG: DNA repair protein RadA [Gammaproteobacteria bacterium]|nr:DNA repair protein RadA [Gammaproteobacteria bacterium]